MARDGSTAVASEATGLTRCGTEPMAVASAGRRPGNAALIASTLGSATEGRGAHGSATRWPSRTGQVSRSQARGLGRAALTQFGPRVTAREARWPTVRSMVGRREPVPFLERDRRRTSDRGGSSRGVVDSGPNAAFGRGCLGRRGCCTSRRDDSFSIPP